MAEAIVSLVLEQLVKVAGRLIQQEAKLVKGVDDEIEKLTSNFQTIQAVLADAEQRQVTEAAVSRWLEKLKDVSYDTDDVLDTWNTAIMKRVQTEGAENNLKTKVHSFFLFPRSFLRQVVLGRSIAFKIKAINERLDDIVTEKDNYQLNATLSIETPHRQLESTSFTDVFEVIGRDELKNALVDKLCESCEERSGLHTISIVGMGGIGKTTLAQLAYNSNKVIKNFEKRIWVCVSDPFDKLRIAKAILETLEGNAPNISKLQSLLEKINESLRTKKFLIVLDDVWTECDEDWKPFHDCLKNGHHGSKVLVTTRKKISADMMKSIDPILIESLPEKYCWSLFSRLALFGKSYEDCENLEGVGKEIVSKCMGLPLAAKTMGSLLRFKTTRREWENILYSEMWKSKKFEDDALLPLLLSCYDLPPMVRRCFTYCAMFPKDFNFEKDKLIKLWMAQGYLELEHTEELEIIGEEYFNILVMRSFFQEFEKDSDGSIIRFKMHDMVHDVAQYLSKNECCNIEVEGSREENINALCHEKAHNLMLTATQSNTFPITICNFKKLRSLLIQFDRYVGDKSIGKVLPKLFDELTCLKALQIRLLGMEKKMHISKEIGKLIHLRYLDLSNNLELEKLPETLCELYNLQTLKLDGCESLKVLPHEIGKLINLRHLMSDNTRSLEYMPKGIKSLTRLRTLSEFHLDGGIYGGKACPPECLNNFGHLESLCIQMSLSNSKKHEAILEAFQPTPKLQELTIKYYGGPTLRRMASLTNLRSITLNQCVNCLHVPPLGKLPSLETLFIRGMDSVGGVGNEFLGVENGEASSSSSSIIYFPNLKTLRFEWMRKWEVWDFGNEDDTCTIMPSLRSLMLYECYQLKGLPKQLLHQTAPLQHLEISGCDILEEVYSKGKGDKWQDICHISDIVINPSIWGWMHAK